MRRYPPEDADDGLAGGEGAFLMCTFWLADCLTLHGSAGQALARFERLLALRNDVGLLSEQYDPSGRMLGNFPQAFSHVSLVSTAETLGGRNGFRSRRSRTDPQARWSTNLSSWRRLRHSNTPSQWMPYSPTIESPVSQ